MRRGCGIGAIPLLKEIWNGDRPAGLARADLLLQRQAGLVRMPSCPPRHRDPDHRMRMNASPARWNSWRGSLRVSVLQSLLPVRDFLTHRSTLAIDAAAMTQMVQLMQMRISQRLLTLWIAPECGEGEVRRR